MGEEIEYHRMGDNILEVIYTVETSDNVCETANKKGVCMEKKKEGNDGKRGENPTIMRRNIKIQERFKELYPEYLEERLSVNEIFNILSGEFDNLSMVRLQHIVYPLDPDMKKLKY